MCLNVHRDSIKFISKIQRKFKIQKDISPLFIRQREKKREGEGNNYERNYFVDESLHCVIVFTISLSFKAIEFIFKKGRNKKKQREIAIGEQKSKMNFVPFRSVSKEKRKKRGGTEKQRPIKNVNVKRFIRMNSRGGKEGRGTKD